MSHTSEVSGIVFMDIEALRSAVNELKTKGIKCSLVANSVPRAFYPNQTGLGLAPWVLKLDDSPYDVGFYQDGKAKGYTARTDLWGGHVSRILGSTAPAKTGENPTQVALGRLFQTYAVHAATRKAVQQGMTVKRIDAPDGGVRLVIGGIA